MIEARKVTKTYTMGKVTLQVLKGVSLQLDTTAFVAVMGPSGAGKSTLLHLLAGLDTPTSGTVLWDEQPLSTLSDARRAAFRNSMLGIVFQFYHLLPELTALENVLLPGLVNGPPPAKLRSRAEACLTQVGLKARMRHRPRELSGGEQQRVAIARALVNEPKMLLCDEPTGNLDSKTGGDVIELLVNVHKKQGVVLVLVTHQEKLAALADEIITLEDGRVQDAHLVKGAS